MKRRTFLDYGAGAALGGLLAACGGGHNQSDMAQNTGPSPQFASLIAWNNAALQAVLATRPGPPMAARSLAVLQTAIYETWTAYERRSRDKARNST